MRQMNIQTVNMEFNIFEIPEIIHHLLRFCRFELIISIRELNCCCEEVVNNNKNPISARFNLGYPETIHGMYWRYSLKYPNLEEKLKAAIIDGDETWTNLILAKYPRLRRTWYLTLAELDRAEELYTYFGNVSNIQIDDVTAMMEAAVFGRAKSVISWLYRDPRLNKSKTLIVSSIRQGDQEFAAWFSINCSRLIERVSEENVLYLAATTNLEMYKWYSSMTNTKYFNLLDLLNECIWVDRTDVIDYLRNDWINQGDLCFILFRGSLTSNSPNCIRYFFNFISDEERKNQLNALYFRIMFGDAIGNKINHQLSLIIRNNDHGLIWNKGVIIRDIMHSDDLEHVNWFNNWLPTATNISDCEFSSKFFNHYMNCVIARDKVEFVKVKYQILRQLGEINIQHLDLSKSYDPDTKIWMNQIH